MTRADWQEIVNVWFNASMYITIVVWAFWGVGRFVLAIVETKGLGP